MDIAERLEQIGLSNNEIKVYLHLIDNGARGAGKIAKGAGIQRSSAYGAINSLVHKGLIAYALIGNVKQFQATSPYRLIEYIKEQEELIQDIVPELKARHKAHKKSGQVRLFKGIRGVKAVFKDMLRTGDNNYCFGEDGNLERRMPIFSEQFANLQEKNKIKTKILTRSRNVRYSKYTTYRFVDEATESNVAINIYGDKVNFVIWTDEPEAVIIENKEAAKALKNYFKFMWKHAKTN